MKAEPAWRWDGDFPPGGYVTSTATRLFPGMFGMACSKTVFTCERSSAYPAPTPSAIAANTAPMELASVLILIKLPPSALADHLAQCLAQLLVLAVVDRAVDE